MALYRDRVADAFILTQAERARLRGDEFGYQVLFEFVNARVDPSRVYRFARKRLGPGPSLVDTLLSDGPNIAHRNSFYLYEARRGPFRAIGRNGLVDASRLRALFEMNATVLAKALGMRSLRNKLWESPGVQSNAIALLGSMNMLASTLCSRKYARYWLRTPQHELGSTPMKLLSEGHLDIVIGSIFRIVMMTPD